VLARLRVASGVSGDLRERYTRVLFVCKDVNRSLMSTHGDIRELATQD